SRGEGLSALNNSCKDIRASNDDQQVYEALRNPYNS
nr:hypothetical protein [Tanacetum cinerariifolium]